jgi:hypothetical protein
MNYCEADSDCDRDNRVGTGSPFTADAAAKLVYREPRGNLPVEAVAFVSRQKR